ncbi:uncharacterized protein [Anabrus simplex]|uniref:uncharacterized protein isoform X2 n=1 Tax=Anabrus simplex TaxID=316456 RepID=UPI0035A3C525
MVQTGGGPFTTVVKNPVLDKVREMIQFSTEGLPSIFDSDAMRKFTKIFQIGNNILKPSYVCNFTVADSEFFSFVIADVPVITVLAEEADNMNEHHAEAQGSYVEKEMNVPVMSPEDLQNYKCTGPVESIVTELSYTGSTGAEDVASSSSAVVSAQYNECDNDWSNYTPRMLKKRKSIPLRNALSTVKNSSPTVNCQPSVRTSSVSGQKLSSWVTEKKCLATLQQELLKKQFVQREKREQELHAMEMKIKKAQLLSLKMDIQIKRKTLSNIQRL